MADRNTTPGSPSQRPRRGEPARPANDGSLLLIAIGDLHGHYPALESLLDALDRQYGIFSGSAPGRLARGVTLVFTGDYIDRGSSALDIILRLRRLAAANPKRVVTLFGNHELLALEYFDRARELAAAESVGGLEEYEATTVHGRNGGGAFVREFGRSTARAALANYAERMDRSGDIGGWLRSLFPWYEAQVGSRTFLFTHSDFSQELLAPRALDRYKANLLRLLNAGSASVGGAAKKYGHPWLTDSAGFFWCRSFGRLEDASDEAIESLCAGAEADYIVTGHTPHPGEIRAYGGRIFDIDVGMTPKYGENLPQALVVSETGVVAFSADGREKQLARFRPGEKRVKLVKAGMQCRVCGRLLSGGAACPKHGSQ